MNKTVGVCGFVSTGSSAFSDFLREFEGTQVLDAIEFNFTYMTDGLEDLDYHVNNFHKVNHSIIAIDRFRKFMKNFDYIIKNSEITNSFLSKIIQSSWNGYAELTDKLVRSRGEIFIKKCIFKMARILHLKKMHKIYLTFFPYKMEFCIMPEEFEKLSKIFIFEILETMGRDRNLITILDQPFEACDPVKSFKFFENPRAIIVDRDPRDHYLFVKNFLRPRGYGYQIPCDNVDEYIKYFRFIRQSPLDLCQRDDVIFFNFEELVYDYENTVKKIVDFVGVSNHLYKKMFFKPTHSRNNTQLFRKYAGFESDIKKIERELSEFIFHFENYPDIKSEGKMFFGSQSRKGQ